MSDFDLGLENINSSLDLVTFRPVRDCFSTEQRIRVQYDLGDDFDPDVLDYIGLYNTEWKTVHDHLAYKWAPLPPGHYLFPQRRRCVQFKDSDFEHVRMPDVDFLFLYVANGDHVVGVSDKFRFPRTPGYDDDLCFNTLERRLASPKLAQETRKRHVVNLPKELSFCSPTKRRPVKEKVTQVFKDHDSLTSDFHQPATLLNIVHPVVREYEQQTNTVSVVPYVSAISNQCTGEHSPAQFAVGKVGKSSQKRLVFDIKNNDHNKTTEPRNFVQPCLEFPVRLPISPGPQGILEVISAGVGSCTFCSLSKVVISDLVYRERMHEATIQKLKAELAASEAETACVKRKQKTRHYGQFAGSREEHFYKKKIGDLLKKNNGLHREARKWKNEYMMARPQPKQLINDEKDKETQTSDHSIQAITIPKQQETPITAPSNPGTTSLEEESEWKIQKPKRMARLQQVIFRQSQTIQTINTTVSNQRETINRQARVIAEFRQSLCEQQLNKTTAENKLTEMTDVVKGILRGRYKEKASEWRQFARQIHNETPHEAKPSGAASQHYGRSGKDQRQLSGVHQPSVYSSGLQYIPGKSERVCPTCDMIFLPHVDPHVIEEHVVFHQIYKRKPQST